MRAHLIARLGKSEKNIHEFYLQDGYLSRLNESRILVEAGMRYGHIQQSMVCGADRYSFECQSAISLLADFEEYRLRREFLLGHAVDVLLLPEPPTIRSRPALVEIILDDGDSLEIPFLQMELSDPKAKAILAMLGHPADLMIRSSFGYCAYIDEKFYPIIFSACEELAHLEPQAKAGGWRFFVINKFFQ